MTFGRRTALRIGLTSAFSLGFGPALGAARSLRVGRARACILLFLEGGASQIDTWDPKPGRPTGGPFNAIASSVPGVHVSEHLPLLAARMHQLAVLRTVTGDEGNHERARRLLQTIVPKSEAANAAYEDDFPGACLGAVRAVESGATFVQVTQSGWDTHEDCFDRIRHLSRELDAGMSALLTDLDARGLLDSTLVVCMGEFGRTPTINPEGGRDHFPAISSVVLAGGGIRAGQVIGATDIDGREIIDRPITRQQLARTIAVLLGRNDATRRDALPIVELLAP